MNTAFYKINNQTKRMVDNELTQKELAQELRDNGFKVIKIFKDSSEGFLLCGQHFIKRNIHMITISFCVCSANCIYL